MNFDIKYAGVGSIDDNETAAEGMWATDTFGRCAVCSNATRWISVDFERYICSDECWDKVCEDLLKASLAVQPGQPIKIVSGKLENRPAKWLKYVGEKFSIIELDTREADEAPKIIVGNSEFVSVNS